MRPPYFELFAAAALGVALLSGCGRAPEPPQGTSEAHLHHHHAPHAGTVIALGEEEYHLELVLDRDAGKLQAFVLDSELENFVRSTSATVEISANVAGSQRSLILSAVANPETGESVGDTSLFEGTAEWLKTTPGFDAVLKSISIRGSSYADVKFNFPKGNEATR